MVIANEIDDLISNPEQECDSLRVNILRRGTKPAVLPKLWLNDIADWVLKLCLGNQTTRRKHLSSKQSSSAKKRSLCHILMMTEGLSV